MTHGGAGDKTRKKQDGRGERLAAALRENLRRRKAQERARGASTTAAKSVSPRHGDKDR